MECSLNNYDDNSVLSGQACKKSKIDVVDAESNTVNSGKFLIFRILQSILESI